MRSSKSQSLTLSLPNVVKGKFRPDFQISFSNILKFEKQKVPCVSTGRELSFEWSHHRISSTNAEVTVTFQNSIKHSGSDRIKGLQPILLEQNVWSTKIQFQSLRFAKTLDLNIYFRLTWFQSSFLLIHFRHGHNSDSHHSRVWHRTYLICDALLQRLARCRSLSDM